MESICLYYAIVGEIGIYLQILQSEVYRIPLIIIVWYMCAYGIMCTRHIYARVCVSDSDILQQSTDGQPQTQIPM